MIHKKSEIIAKIKRKVRFADKIVLITDKIIPFQDIKLEKLAISKKHSWIFSASANQFDNLDHYNLKIDNLDTSKLFNLTKGKYYEFSREIDPSNETIKWL